MTVPGSGGSSLGADFAGGFRGRAPRLLRGSRARIGIVVAAAAGVLALLWSLTLIHFHGDFTGFVVFGHYFAHLVQPPADALVGSKYGYDGQFFWRIAVDPLLHDSATIGIFHGQEYRAQRMLYPALAWLLAGGAKALIPYTLQIVGWAAALTLVGVFARVAEDLGRSPWWGLPLGLQPGIYLGMTRDLADPLAVALLVVAILALDRERPALAAIATAAAVLTRESMVLLVVALVASIVLARMDLPERLRAPVPRYAALVAGVGLAAYVAWQAYAASRLGKLPGLGTSQHQFTGPLNAVMPQLSRTAHEVTQGGRFILLAIANPVYLVALCAAAWVAFWAAAQRLDVPAICAALFAVVGLTQQYGDHWSYTRATAPLFALLAYIALRRGYRRTLVLVAALVALLPMYPP